MRDMTLLTGATGALGSELLKRLIANGETVLCLVRGNDKETLQGRIERIIGKKRNVKVISGDVCKSRCGISDNDRELYRNQVSRIIHCAASISFLNRREAEATNVGGVHNVLELATVLGIPDFHHVSTVYVCGDAAEFSEDTIVSSITHRPRNVYEETKQEGEALIRAWVANHSDCRYSIYRPSILIGREDGTTPTFDAYYGYFKPLQGILEAMRARKDAGKELPQGVSIDEYGVVDIPLVLRASSKATLNLVPIDWVADMMVALFSIPPGNKVYHLVNPRPPLVRFVIDVSLKHLRMRVGAGSKMKVVESEEEKRKAMALQSPLVSRLQRQLDRVLEQYDPYTNHGPVFLGENVRQVLGDGFRTFRTLDADFFRLFLTYALHTNWGASKNKE